MRFPPAFIERLRSHFLMSEVVGKRVPLKKFGREWKACCPFHNEKSPSFTVNDEKGFYHCFGCGAHGDAIEFIRKHERLSYPEAIETLARDAGIPLPEVSPETIRRIESYKQQQDVVEAACQWFEKQLHSASHVDALSYIEKRGINPSTIRQFRLGYAPDERTSLHNHLATSGYNVEQQIEAGLISRSEDGKIYDRFRGRLIFPIRNASGKVIAFGGRVLNNNNKNIAKYLNSPETDLFKKGEVLFNLDLAKRPARDKNTVVVMEGYMDVVSTAQGGIDYAVATLGTAVTAEHLRLLWQLSKEPVFCLDGDAAGQRAMLRAAEIALPLIAPGHSLRFAVLPKGEDPDSYIQKHGKEAFEKLLAHSKRLSQVLWETLSPQYKLNLAEGRAGLEGAFTKLAKQINDPTVRQHFVSFFKKQLWEATSSKKPAAKTRSTKVEQVVAQHHSTALEMLTSRMLKTLVIFPSLLERASVEEFVSHVTIATPRLGTLRDAILVLAHDDHVSEPESFRVKLIEAVQESWCIEFVADALKLPYSSTLSAGDAVVLWNETVSAYQIAHMQHELTVLQEQVGGMDEDGLKRLVDLQNAIRSAQTARTFAPMQSDVA
ncbi:MAG: DNA primase [Alphaproteobacteria bacterium]|nr:DNA primase [Alphaproteobacteria bacterium]